jgi:LysM repeat protein
MNTPNPLIPQGTLERQSKGKSTARIAILTIVSIHAVFFAGLLMQGCRRDDTKGQAVKTSEASTNQALMPATDSGYYPGTTDLAQSTNTPSPAATNIPLVASEPIVTTPSAPIPASEPLTDGKPYKVAKGDTLAKIAKANGVSVGALKNANPSVEPSKLKVGQTIQIPAATSTAGLGFAEPGKSDTNASSASGNVHTVKAGETLTRIAKQHNTTVKAIQAANNMKTQRLYVGQKLKLPAASAPTSTAMGANDLSTTSKLTATNPAHVSPMPSAATTNMR